ncbi:hypothetical protein DPMN_057473 [Dreissena polymorpha]|uniref:Uncharacterized protein n=1 Tax=Dreissena polymorpha TaxID=45954 RepID=A0A9D4C015_DREPO|nr:hypothetical protein DPMN_057473 [Dreissena polymorpha]
MASTVVTSRRPDPRDGFHSTLSVLSTAAPGHFYKANPSKFWTAQCLPRTSSMLVSPLSRCSCPTPF